jgi:hypothetical protein
MKRGVKSSRKRRKLRRVVLKGERRERERRMGHGGYLPESSFQN